MLSIADVADFLEAFAPPRLAESWDNVGLLVGSRQAIVERVMTCLTVTPATVREAVENKANLVVTHHPFPFRPLKQLTDDTPEGRMLLQLIAAGVGVYSPHTAFDSAAEGINARLAEGLALAEVRPLVPSPDDSRLGGGRFGKLAGAVRLSELAARVKSLLKIEQAQLVGDAERMIRTVAVACGSAGEFLGPARSMGCDCLVTGEVRFHTALEAEATEMSLVLAGHYASERFAVEALAEVLSQRFSTAHIWASTVETDPLRWV